MAAGITQVPVDQIAAESKEEFNELLNQYQQTNKAKSDLESSKQALDSELEDLRKDLEKQKALADGRLNEEAEKALIDSSGVIPLFHLPRGWMLSSRVKNWPRFEEVWLGAGAAQ